MTTSKTETPVIKPVKAVTTVFATAPSAPSAPVSNPSKAVVKAEAIAKVKAAPRKAKTSVKTVAVAQPKAVAKPKSAPKAAPTPKVAAKPKVKKPAKEKKPKLVRDSFTIPKPEYAVLDDLKTRANRLVSPAKKSELLRAGIKALAAMSDAAFQAALRAVPAIKTGRPAKE